MDAEIKAKWTAALRSGNYQQAFGMLRLDGRFCCLGVLCDISGIGEWTATECFAYPDDTTETVLPTSMRLAYGISDAAERWLMEMNDGGASFAEIADYIEVNL